MASKHSQSKDSDDLQQQWEEVLRAGVEAQDLISGSIAVGGTAAALYAHHRISLDTDHLLPNLVERFDEVREKLEQSEHWKTARIVPPKMILGSLGDVQVGFRQMIRSRPVETVSLPTTTGGLVVPTLDELIGMKAYLAYSRRATRDFLDLAALASCTDDQAVLTALLRSDERYGELQTDSVGLEIAKALADPQPYDLDSVDLGQYKGVKAPWDQWSFVEATCKRFGVQMAASLVQKKESQ